MYLLSIAFILQYLAIVYSLGIEYQHEYINNSTCFINYLNVNGFEGYTEVPYSSSYNETVNIDNKRVVTYPAIIVIPKIENDVSITILGAQYCNMSFSVRSGGHSAAGYCLSSGGVTLDMWRGMNKVKYISGVSDIHTNTGQMYVESGANWSDIYNVAKSTPYIPIGGGCPSVAAGGFLLGGKHYKLI